MLTGVALTPVIFIDDARDLSRPSAPPARRRFRRRQQQNHMSGCLTSRLSVHRVDMVLAGASLFSDDPPPPSRPPAPLAHGNARQKAPAEDRQDLAGR